MSIAWDTSVGRVFPTAPSGSTAATKLPGFWKFTTNDGPATTAGGSSIPTDIVSLSMFPSVSAKKCLPVNDSSRALWLVHADVVAPMVRSVYPGPANIHLTRDDTIFPSVSLMVNMIDRTRLMKNLTHAAGSGSGSPSICGPANAHPMLATSEGYHSRSGYFHSLNLNLAVLPAAAASTAGRASAGSCHPPGGGWSGGGQ